MVYRLTITKDVLVKSTFSEVVLSDVEKYNIKVSDLENTNLTIVESKIS
jgi:hypothetical protein